jgi:O-acetyl-ADP-ribose deacetylase (regulator of RNase III)
MITYTEGNLLEAHVESLVNTVNTVGVMGKGIALMFKERFPVNFRAYAAACKKGEVQVGKIFVTEPGELDGPRWIVNFPTKQDWRHPSRIEWVEAGLQDLRRFLVAERVKSIAIPPLGAGNGGLNWRDVKPLIESALGDLDVRIMVFEPTSQYQNVAKREGVKTLTVPRALIAESIRRYWVLGTTCSLLEVQKLAWFLERSIRRLNADDSIMRLDFQANKYGPYANGLMHLLNAMDGSYLHCEKRLGDASPFQDPIWFDETQADRLRAFLGSEAKPYALAIDETANLIDGFETPFGMELLATVDWLIEREGCAPDVASIRSGLSRWAGGAEAAARKNRVFDDRAIDIALNQLRPFETASA